MAYTIEQQVAGSGGLVARRDPGVNAGTLLSINYRDPVCNPLAGTFGAPTALAAGVPFANLADSGLPDGVTVGTSNRLIMNPDGSITTPGAGANGQVVTFGAAGAYDLHADNPDFIVHLWMSIALDAPTAQPQRQIFGLGTAGTNQFWIDTGTTNNTPRAVASATAGVPAFRNLGGTAPEIQLYSVAKVGAVSLTGRAGLLTSSVNGATTIPDMSAAILTMFDARSKLTVHGGTIERLDWSIAEALTEGRTWSAAQAAAAEYAAGVARGFIT
jgi:hypothetical protein